ncbi:MAG: acyl-CoA thioesterase [Gammaproteobacteria bacterium]|nr:acyl-CoA thioesterase [Gammaproteobacteria bacterium]
MTNNNLPADRQPVIRVVPYPQDTNPAGDIFGGWIISQVDVAGSIVASRRAQGRVATVAVNAVQFKKPVFVGDLISCYASIVKVGNTSVTVDVEVFAERGWTSGNEMGECIRVTEATLTYVAIGKDRRARTVPRT